MYANRWTSKVEEDIESINSIPRSRSMRLDEPNGKFGGKIRRFPPGLESDKGVE